jgi:hypothetical protein
MIPVTVEALQQCFVRDGFVHIEHAFTPELARECRLLLSRDLGCDAEDPSTWTRPVVRLGDYPQEPFRRAANTPALHAAFDALVGRDRWIARSSLGGFPIRFPSDQDPGDTGWHADAGFYGSDQTLRLNLQSSGRALLMLFFFTDVEENDAPTRIKVGSHLDVPRLLEPAGEAGLTYLELAARFDPDWDHPIALAIGAAGDVYLCHPFLVHAAQRHRGVTPKFMAQPPLQPAHPIALDRADGGYSPVETAIRIGLGLEGR